MGTRAPGVQPDRTQVSSSSEVFYLSVPKAGRGDWREARFTLLRKCFKMLIRKV